MSSGLYAGEDVGALVFDSGSYSFRAGYAGEECPSIDIPASVGVRNKIEETPDGTRETRETFIGDIDLYIPRSNTEIKGYMKDGMIEEWDLFEQVMDYIYNKCFRVEPSLHGVLFSEAPWTTKDKREKLTELMFEKYNVPAFYTVKSPVLTCFAHGKASGLVVDSGASQTYASSVHDGYCLINSVVKSNLGGDTIVDQMKKYLDRCNVDIIPSYRIASKEEYKEGEKPLYKLKDIVEVTESFETYHKKKIIEDVVAATLQLVDNIETEDLESTVPGEYDFSTGLHKEIKRDRVTIPESLFNIKYLDVEEKIKETIMDIPTAVVACCSNSDVDLRNTLYSNVIVTGGNSLIDGFSERLNHGIAVKCPPTVKIRFNSGTTPMEKRFGAWIGGSIVASLGTFQQLWISKAEYEESGKVIVNKKCS
ncbi:Brahma associated protein 55kD [Strongyloides ratti]|uniref:Brahma associated protein 55kD n=1 Tax=Strongyloides ratti TaxID=34506 RepID=A0A090LDL3_STRRB|nr:Brahma associated protein 55kD [Strongyloides ratti]CEF67857.1 Brahma associated protein 55kD [Strongyloides ratti]